MKTNTELTIEGKVLNLMHFEFSDELYIELEDGDSVKVPCTIDNYIQMFRNLLCANEPLLDHDLNDVDAHNIEYLKEIKDALNSNPLL